MNRARRPRGAWLFAIVVSVLALAAPASAQSDDDSAVRGAARLLAEQGDAKLHVGRFEEALSLFRMAEELFHAPTLVLAMAQAERQLGRWAEARKHYREVIAEDLGARPPQAFLTAKAIAREELEKLEPKIPRLLIEVDPRPEPMEVRLDGRALPVEALDGPLYVDEGKHEVMLIAGDVVRVERVEIAAGEEKRLLFDMRPEPAQGERGFASSEVASFPWWWSATAFGLGATGLVVGTATGILALEDASTLRDTCLRDTQGCDPAARSLQDSANTLATVSTIGFVVGAVGVAAGVTILVVDQTVDSGEVAVVVGPGGLALAGSF